MSMHPAHYLTFQTTCYISEQSIYWSFCLLEAIESFYVIRFTGIFVTVYGSSLCNPA